MYRYSKKIKIAPFCRSIQVQSNGIFSKRVGQRTKKLHAIENVDIFAWVGQHQHQPSARDQGPVAGIGGRVVNSGVSSGKGESLVVCAVVNCISNVCGSARLCGCVVNGSFVRAAV